MFFNNNIYFDYTAKSYAITCGVSIMNEKDFGKYWSITYEKVMQNLQSSIAGLSDEEAQKRLKEYGENTIKREKKATKLILFLKQLKNPIMLILIFATLVFLFSAICSAIIFIASFLAAKAPLVDTLVLLSTESEDSSISLYFCSIFSSSLALPILGLYVNPSSSASCFNSSNDFSTSNSFMVV